MHQPGFSIEVVYGYIPKRGAALHQSTKQGTRAFLSYGCFGVWYSTSFWNGFQTVSKPTNPFR
jgi:hypothetical protein